MTRPLETLSGWNLATARRVYLRSLRLDARIGVHPHEYEGPQPIIISLELEVTDGAEAQSMRFLPPERPHDQAGRDVVCYEALSNGIRALIDSGHIDYVETLAERIADLCLSDDRVRQASVRVEKPQAVRDAAGAGVEIVRRR